MKLLTKNSDYAVRALLYVTLQPGRFVSSREIAGAESIPLVFLRRILQQLVKAGILAAKEGVNGGVMLCRKPEQIRLVDIMELMQGQLQLTECLFQRKLCRNRGTCVLRHRLRDIERIVTNEFAAITLGSLLTDLAGGDHEAKNNHD